jgi:hypothetical protein
VALFALKNWVVIRDLDNSALMDFRDWLSEASGEFDGESPVTQYLGHGPQNSRFPLMESDQEVWLRGRES